MTYIGSFDYNLDVLRGLVSGHAMVEIIGHDDSLSTTRVTLAPTLVTADIDQSGIHAVAATVDVASTDANDDVAGSGLLTLTLAGLDSSGNAQTETITLTGQTEVTSANTYTAIHGFRGLTAGSGKKNAGTIWIGNGTFTAGVPATKYDAGIIGHNKGSTAYYTVPTGKTLYLRQLIQTMVGSNKEAEVNIESSSDGIFWVTEIEFGIESGVDFVAPIISVPGIPAASSVRVTAKAAASGTELTVILGCELVDN